MNLFKLFQGLIHTPPLQVGTVTATIGGVALVTVPDGGQLVARGDATVGDLVWVRDGVIEGVAPALTLEQISV
jgi:hypothetical protein